MLTLVVHYCAGCHFQPDTLITPNTVTILNVVMTLYSITVKAILLVANMEGYLLSSACAEPKIVLICKISYSRAYWRVYTFFVSGLSEPLQTLIHVCLLCGCTLHLCSVNMHVILFTLTHLARRRFYPQRLSHQHPTSHTQPDKVVSLSHYFNILLLLFRCGKS